MKQINEIDLNSYRDRVYQNAVNHGWHEEKKSIEHWLCMVMSELMEAVEADRLGKYADRTQFENYMNLKERSNDEFVYAFKHGIKDTVEDELADACIRLFDMAGVICINMDYLNMANLCTEDYNNMSFTESMFCLIKKIVDFNCNGKLLLILNEVFAFCRSRNIDIFWFIEQKMKYNESRPFKHGGKKY